MIGNVVDTLLHLFEYIVQGVLTALVLGYVLVWAHPVKDSVTRSIGTITRYLLYPHWQEKVPSPAIAIILLGSAYFLGVISNVAGYWLLEPVHGRVIHSVAAATNPSSPTFKGFTPEADAPYWNTVLLPLRIGKAVDDFPAYRDHLREKVLWANCKLDAMQDALNPLLKQSRIIRGVAVCALTFSLIAILKAVYFSCVWLLLHFRPRLGDWLYRRTVKNPIPDEPEGSTGTDKKRSFIDTKRAIQAALTYAIFATSIYLSSIAGWRAVEVEYHLTAHYGSQTCGPAKALALLAGAPTGGPQPTTAPAPPHPRSGP
ncbi:MAG: hypothetical protein M3O15_15390 [Acidobacteriota bacterium]|nr:hypothetical protein [Acidobacteriota bacterium]